MSAENYSIYISVDTTGAIKAIDSFGKEVNAIVSGVKGSASGLMSSVKTEIDNTFGANAIRKSTEKLSAVEQGVNRIQRAFMGVGLYMGTYTIYAWARAGIQDLAELDRGMAKLKAITGASAAEMQQMGEIARGMGLKTEYAASKAVEAMVQLGQAGFSARETMQSLPDVLNLSTIGMMDIEKATIVTANIMEEFGLKSTDTTRIVDVMAKTAVRTVADVKGLANAFTYIGPIAASLGISVEQTAAALGTLTNAGLKSDRAGTSLRKIFDELSRSSDKLAEASKKLGVSEDDLIIKNGNLFQVMEKLGRLSPSTLMDLFGVRGGTGAVALSRMAQSADSLEKELNKATATSKVMADIMRDNLATSFEMLLSTIKEVIYQVGEMGLTGAMKSLINTTASTLRVIVGVGNASDRASIGVSSLAIAVDSLAGALILLAATRIPAVLEWLRTFAINMSPQAKAISAVGILVGAFHKEIYDFVTNTDTSIEKTKQRVRDLETTIPELVNKIGSLGVVQNKTGMESEKLTEYMDELKKIAPDLARLFSDIAESTGDWAKATEKVNENIRKMTFPEKLKLINAEIEKTAKDNKQTGSFGNSYERSDFDHIAGSIVNLPMTDTEKKIVQLKKDKENLLDLWFSLDKNFIDIMDEFENYKVPVPTIDEDTMDKALQRFNDFKNGIVDQLEMLDSRMDISSKQAGSWARKEAEIEKKYQAERNRIDKSYRKIQEEKGKSTLDTDMLKEAETLHTDLISKMEKEKYMEIEDARREYLIQQNQDYKEYSTKMQDIIDQSNSEIEEMLDYTNSKQEDRIKASYDKRIDALMASAAKERTRRVWDAVQIEGIDKQTADAKIALEKRASAEIQEIQKKRAIETAVSYQELFQKESEMLTDFETKKNSLSLSKFSNQRKEYEGEMQITNAYRMKNEQLQTEINILQARMEISQTPELDKAQIEAKQREMSRNEKMQRMELDDYLNRGTVWDGARAAMWDYQDEALKTAENVKAAFTTAFKGMEDLFVEFTTTGKMSFKTFTDQIMSDIMRLAYQQTIGGVLKSLFDTKSGTSGLLGSLGKLFGGGKATGGYVNPNTAYVVGENGPELFLPSNMGYVLPSNRLGGTVNNTNANTQIQVNNHYYQEGNNTKSYSTTFKRSMEPSDKQLMNKLAKTLQGVS